MRIQSMFQDDINRKINGVVKVDQDESSVLVQELNEYVITRELKKHFITFFNNYIESFNETTADVGVWISGFFGSGKSHFLKMLSYLLVNKEVQGVKTVERFRAKFADDPATFMLIDRATKGRTDTILFNIDIEGSINKGKTAVLRVFAKMFYNYLGFYGENLKVAKLEQFIAKKGKTEEFRRVFEEKNGASWLESRDAYAFFEDDIVATLQEVLGMSEQAASNWFNGTETVETSIAQLVSEIKEYVDAQPRDFRLLFMIDEVGQYVGGDTDLLINLQSLVEKIGSECGGKVWVVCTGQEAIDEIIKARENEFSRIQARFKTRLSLSSSSADEVIQKRILLKTDEAEHDLEQVYAANDSVLRDRLRVKQSAFAGIAMIEIHDIRKKDYKKARQFAIDGMHLNWYMDSKLVLDLYARYFWNMEMNRATKVYGAYVGDAFVGVLLADMKSEPKRHQSILKQMYVKMFDWLQHLVAGKGVGAYDEANRDMYRSFCRNSTPDGEIIFLAADPDCGIKGIGTALLTAFESEESGKLVYLYTDDACTYQFYEHRGFSRSESRDVTVDLGKKKVPLKCLLYSKRIL